MNVGDKRLFNDDLKPFANYRTLDLSEHGYTSVPAGLGSLANLEELILNGNELRSLPSELCQLRKLIRLEVNSNQISALPREIGQLRELRTLRVAGNRLTELPVSISGMSKLEDLDIGANQITELPTLSTMRSLERLDLRDNQIGRLPDIADLKYLEYLDLRNNRFTGLPASLGTMLRGRLLLHAGGNPFLEPFPELLERGADALATYLLSLDDGQTQFDAKLVVVGEGNVGKTSLVAAILGEPFVEGRPTTHGIEIRIIQLPHPTLDTRLTLHTWDFGGQEVYRVTHPFFFSRRAIYLVVWKPREGQEPNDVEGWLRRIRLRVGEEAASALVVATHCAERRPYLAFERLKRAVPGLLEGSFEVDSSNADGIPSLRTALADVASQLPQMGQRLSQRWIRARDNVLQLASSTPRIDYQLFTKICGQCELDDFETQTLAGLLHDQGHIVHYQSESGLQDTVVLNPEWLTKAISYVLEDKATRDANGILDHRRLREIWGNPRHGQSYSVEHHPFFLRLMEKFDISYRLAENPDHSLVAQLVQVDIPVLPWMRTDPILEGWRALRLVCKLSEPAPGFISWLTVRHHNASVRLHWTGGIFLKHPITEYASEALIEQHDDTQLTLEVRAPSPDLFFNVLRDSIEYLARTRWPGLTYRLWVPCPTQDDRGRPCEGMFPLDGLLTHRERNGYTQNCLHCHAIHQVSLLLTGFDTSKGHIWTAITTTEADNRLKLIEAKVNNLDDVTKAISGMNATLERVDVHTAGTAHAVRMLLKAASNEVTDCPRLFSITKPKASGFPWPRWLRPHMIYRLCLWCEHPGDWHPADHEGYQVQQPRALIARIRPYFNVAVRALQLVGPIAGGVAELLKTDEKLIDALNVVNILIGYKTSEGRSEIPSWQDGLQAPLSPAEGAALRQFRTILFELDPTRTFSGLRRVSGPEGDVVWVCADHYKHYDPGLPRLPS